MLTLDLGLDIVNGVGRLHLKGDSLTRKGLDEDLHLDEGLRKKKSVRCSRRRKCGSQRESGLHASGAWSSHSYLLA